MIPSQPPTDRPGVPPPLKPVPDERRPWGAWRVLGATVLIFAAAEVVPAIFTLAVVFARKGRAALELAAKGADGTLISIIAIMAVPIGVGLSWFFAGTCAPGAAASFLGFRKSSVKVTLASIAAIAAFIVAQDSITYFLGREIVHQSMIDAYRSAGSVPALFVAVIVAAPILEEVIMRGFLLEGLRRSRLGQRWAIVLSAALFAVIHIQYDAYIMGWIFLGALLLGHFRVRTGSILPPIAMHATMNLVSTFELLYVVRS